ncbi:MAG: EamA family transporter [Gemmataceae bacterium]
MDLLPPRFAGAAVNPYPPAIVVGQCFPYISPQDGTLPTGTTSMNQPTSVSPARPAAWALLLAFALVYISWGTTYLAIKVGVETLPPALFGGVRVCLAGMLLWLYLILRGAEWRLSWNQLPGITLSGLILFVCGNGLINVGERTVASGVASVLAATTTLWMGLLETLWPRGERLTWLGWLGLLGGLGGVLVLMSPKLGHPAELIQDMGPALVLGSAFAWALGSFVLRYQPERGPHLASAAYQMVVGGGSLALIGVLLGEPGQLTAASFTPEAIFSFFYLLIVGSLIGFVAYTWLLGHVSAALAGTYAYVNPVVAILVGWLLNSEPITLPIVVGMSIILLGVALVRGGQRSLVSPSEVKPVAETRMRSQIRRLVRF